MKKDNALTWFIFFLLFPVFILAQEKPFLQFTEDDGLPSNAIKAITQDRKGILWIGTENGISKYDGYSFENLNKTNGLPSNRVWSLAVDKDNTIYAGCFKSGLAIIKNDSVIKTLHLVNKQPNTFRKLLYSNYYQKLFVGTDDGLYILHKNSLIPIKYDKDSTSNLSQILSISEKDSKIFFTVRGGKSQGVYKLIYNNRFPEKSYAKKISIYGRFTSAISDNCLFTSERNIIYKYDLNKPWRQPGVITIDSALFVWTIEPYKNGKLWVGCLGDGRFKSEIILFDNNTNSLQPSGIDPNNQTVNAILYDTISGITWFGRDNGLTAYLETPFEFLDFNEKDNILDIGFAGDSLLILTEKAVYFRYKAILKPFLTKQQITSRIIAEWNKGYSKYGIKFKGLFDASKGCEFASFVQGNDKIYVSTAMGAISVPDLKTYFPFGVGTFKLLKNGGAYAAPDYIPLRYFNSIKKSIEFIQPKDTAGTVKDFFKILESHGTCFFASNINGLVAIKDGKLFRLNENNSAIDNILTNIEKDAYGTIWCASVNGNLFQVEINEKLFIRKKIEMAKYGLIGNAIKWFKFHGRYLFIGTNKGLNVISYTTLISKQPGIEYFYNKYNGYDFVSSVSPEIGRDGKLYVHSTDKVISIDTNLTWTSQNQKGKMRIFKAWNY